MNETIVLLHINGVRYEAELLQSNGTAADPYMTRVYHVAKDPQRGGNPVILKELLSNTRDAHGTEILARARQEARIMARVRDSHLPILYEVIESPPERIWLKIEYVKGRTLKDEFGLDSNNLPNVADIRRLLRVAIEVGVALKVYHQKNIAHRDVTPSNIMIVTGTNKVKLIDIGIGALPRDYTWEQVGRGVRIANNEGVPGYRAPEQGAGRDPLIGPGTHSDIYGLGAVLYHVLTGRTPALPPPRSSRSVELASAYNAVVSLELDQLLIQMLAREPKKRPKIGEVTDQLRHINRHYPNDSREDTYQ